MGKKWKVVDGHPNYEVSRMGQVRNIRTGNILAPYDDGSGYLRVKLDGENCRLHILVAVAHIPNPDPETKNIVNHKRGKSMIAEHHNLNGSHRLKIFNTLGTQDCASEKKKEGGGGDLQRLPTLQSLFGRFKGIPL